jgi:hypothetical protein
MFQLPSRFVKDLLSSESRSFEGKSPALRVPLINLDNVWMSDILV